VSIAFGIVAIVYYPVPSIAFAVIWVAWWLLATGVLGILTAVQQRRSGLPWGWSAAAGVLSVLASGVALVSPPVTLAAIMGLIAGFGIVSGITLVIGALKLRGAVHPMAQKIERLAHHPG
jgi:uncharacterized membrane protein HdeD (DUF308 family)